MHVPHPVPLDVVGEDALALQQPAVLLARNRLAGGVPDLELDLGLVCGLGHVSVTGDSPPDTAWIDLTMLT